MQSIYEAFLIKDILISLSDNWVAIASPESFIEEIKKRFDIVESVKQHDLSNKTNHEQNSCYYSETEIDEDLQNKDNLEFQEARIGYISKIEDLSRMLKHQRNL